MNLLYEKFRKVSGINAHGIAYKFEGKRLTQMLVNVGHGSPDVSIFIFFNHVAGIVSVGGNNIDTDSKERVAG